MSGGAAGEPLPILPLPTGIVLLPGISLRIPVSGRADVPALLASFRGEAADDVPNLAAVSIGCVPMRSPLLRSDGEPLHEKFKNSKQKDVLEKEVNPSQVGHRKLFMYGTLARITGIQGRRPEELYLIVQGIDRFRIDRFVQMKPFFIAEVAYQIEEIAKAPATGKSFEPVTEESFSKFKALALELLGLFKLSAFLPRSTNTLSPFLTRRLEQFVAGKTAREAGSLADFVANLLELTLEDRLRVLAAADVSDRQKLVADLLRQQIETVKESASLTITSTRLPSKVIDITNISQKEREAILRKALGGIARFGSDGSPISPPEDRGSDDEPNELEELRKKLAEAGLSTEAEKVATRELRRLKKLNPAQAEYSVCRTYLETLAEIPWTRGTQDQFGSQTLERARKQFDDDHYGLEKIKKRLLEYLAVLRLKQAINDEIEADVMKLQERMPQKGDRDSQDLPDQEASEAAVEAQIQALRIKRRADKSPILLLVGPPGTGKTSLAKSVATALGRNFHRISLGGVRDEAEIRGHRRTYVAAMPGVIVNGLRKVGVNNPVFLLDEIDKVGGNNFHGDPSAAMLEVLDPEQNNAFNDHYLNIPLDLSKVLFIATANTLDTIPPPLLDRMETIELSGYTTVEKHHIATRHLVPKQIMSNGLALEQVNFAPGTLEAIIASYTRESGVRNLEREIGSVCRSKAVEYAEARDAAAETQRYNPEVHPADLEDVLGVKRFEEELAERQAIPGVVTGLVAYSTGGQGSILFIEVADVPGSGRVQLTGKLGDVLKESVEVALTWVKAHAFELGLSQSPSQDIMQNRSVHVHCPSGAVPKDGPSAGLAHTIALISLFSGKLVPPSLAMTGEVSLRGRVMPVGGIKEKLIGAQRAGVKTVLLPHHNRKDVKGVPQEVKDDVEIVYVKHIWEGIKRVWPDSQWPAGEQALVSAESRL